MSVDLPALVADTLRISNIWRGMHRRVYERSYAPYVEDCWHNKEADEGRQAFIVWSLENGYAPGFEIDRIDSKGPYTRENCQWITSLENKVKETRRILYMGKYYNMVELHKEFAHKSLTYQGLKGRLKAGWPLEEALTSPVTRNAWARGKRG